MSGEWMSIPATCSGRRPVRGRAPHACMREMDQTRTDTSSAANVHTTHASLTSHNTYDVTSSSAVLHFAAHSTLTVHFSRMSDNEDETVPATAEIEGIEAEVQADPVDNLAPLSAPERGQWRQAIDTDQIATATLSMLTRPKRGSRVSICLFQGIKTPSLSTKGRRCMAGRCCRPVMRVLLRHQHISTGLRP